MGVAAPPSRPASACVSLLKNPSRPPGRPDPPSDSMSRGFHHQGIFGFSDGFERLGSQEQQQQHVAQQSRRDKLRVQGFDAIPAGQPLVPIDEEAEESSMYEPTAAAADMLSEMFNFPAPPEVAPAGPSATELLASQMSASYGRLAMRPTTAPMGGLSGDSWYGAGRQGMMMGGANLSPMGESSSLSSKHPHAMSALSTDSAAAMHLFLMNPQQQHQQHARSPSPPPPEAQALHHHHQHQALHHHHQHQAFHFFGGGGAAGGAVEGQGLSLSLSSSLQQFEMGTKADELRIRDGVLFFNSQQQQQQPALQLPQEIDDRQLMSGQGQAQQQQLHLGYGPAGVANVLRSSRYSRAAQELLEEFCSVGRGQMKGPHGTGRRLDTPNPNPKSATSTSTSAATAVASSSSKDINIPQLSAADRFEQQRKKTKLISMLDEVDRRYNHYCEQMHMVVSFFDSVMGFGAAAPYTALAQRAMSRHFRCLKDAVAAQLRQACEALGEKDAGAASGLTRGETPRLRQLDQTLRQQRAFHHMGMMEQEAWRPQRGLPERSVTVLRAWLFEHFLHPYPSDADKHLLARQTGLSRNQVSNWFINARVRLWKPMIEDMYQQEARDADGPDAGAATDSSHANVDPARSPTPTRHQTQTQPQHHLPGPSGVHKLEPSSLLASPPDDAVLLGIDPVELLGGDGGHVGTAADDMYQYRAAAMRFGATAGDVSLTLGLRHAGGNATADGRGRFSVRDFGGS